MMAIKISSARFGWLCGVTRDKETRKITDFRWAKRRDSAKPFEENGDELREVHAALYDKGIMHDLNREWVPCVDGK